MALKRTKLAQVERKAKRGRRVGFANKTALKSKLSDLRAFAKGLSNLDKNLTLAALNAIVDYNRLAWIEACNLRDRIIRGRL